jgi:acetyl esterase/lipase
MSERCLSGPGVYVSVLGALSLTRDPEIFEKDPTTGTLGRHLAQNVPPSTITAPLLIAQGAADALVVPDAQKSYVERMRAAGERIDYRTYPGRDHVGLVQADSPLIPQLFAWTTARFGEPSGR